MCHLESKPKKFNKDEVQKVLYVGIDSLRKKENWYYRGLYSNDWIYEFENEILWGATAKMIRSILVLNLDSNSDSLPHP